MNCEYCGREQRSRNAVACWRCGAPIVVEKNLERTENPEPFLNKERIVRSMGYSLTEAVRNGYVAVCSTGMTSSLGELQSITDQILASDALDDDFEVDIAIRKISGHSSSVQKAYGK